MADDYRFGHDDRELQRLGEQHRVWAEDNQRLLARAGFHEGATIVDLGCGPGFTTFDLARLVGPTGRVLAVDRDGERSLPQLGRRAAEAGLVNIDTRAAALETFDLPAQSVDGVYGRWVLMYLSRRDAAALIARLARWIRPGGACALLEISNFRHMTIHPPTAHLAAVVEALFAAVSAGGSNPEIGNELPGLLHDAGLEVDLQVVTKAVRATTATWRWPDALFRDHLQGLVDDGYLAPEVGRAFMAEWEQRTRDPSALFFGSPMMAVVARR